MKQLSHRNDPFNINFNLISHSVDFLNKTEKVKYDLFFNDTQYLDKTENLIDDLFFSDVQYLDKTKKLLYTEYVLDERHPFYKVILHFFKKGILEL